MTRDTSDTDDTDDEHEPLDRYSGMAENDNEQDEMVSGGVDHGYGKGWFEDTDDNGTDNDDTTRNNSVELEQSSGGMPDSPNIEEMDGVTYGGMPSGYGQDWEDDNTAEHTSSNLSCDDSSDESDGPEIDTSENEDYEPSEYRN